VYLDAYLNVREALGFQMRAARTLLRDFVRFLETYVEAGPLRPHTFATFIGVLASTGLRVGEAIRLTMPDVRLETSPPVLHIRMVNCGRDLNWSFWPRTVLPAEYGWEEKLVDRFWVRLLGVLNHLLVNVVLHTNRFKNPASEGAARDKPTLFKHRNGSIGQINYPTKVYLSPNLENLEQTCSWSWMDRLKMIHKFTTKTFEEAFYFLDQFLVSWSLGHRAA
jgi:hypothetical protein